MRIARKSIPPRLDESRNVDAPTNNRTPNAGSKMRRETAKTGPNLREVRVSRAPDECQLRRSVSDVRSARKSARRVSSVPSLHREARGKPFENSHMGIPPVSDCLPSRLLRPQLKSRDYNSNSHEQFLSELSKVDPRGV